MQVQLRLRDDVIPGRPQLIAVRVHLALAIGAWLAVLLAGLDPSGFGHDL
jgi:hypothetical protein